MPLVKPRSKEKREDFLERCMGDQTSMDDYPSRNQRFAVCGEYCPSFKITLSYKGCVK